MLLCVLGNVKFQRNKIFIQIIIKLVGIYPDQMGLYTWLYIFSKPVWKNEDQLDTNIYNQGQKTSLFYVKINTAEIDQNE